MSDLQSRAWAVAALLFCMLMSRPDTSTAAVPDWLAQLESAALPAVDDETGAVALLEEIDVTVQADGSQRILRRGAYRILRRAGQRYATVTASFQPRDRIVRMRGWSVPKEGKPFEVGIKDAIETALLPGSAALVSDTRTKVLTIPAAHPGSLVGFEVEEVSFPSLPGGEWTPQSTIPVATTRYRLRLPPGWSHRAFWQNGAAVEPSVAQGAFTWELRDLPALKLETGMPSQRTLLPYLYVAIEAPEERLSSFRDWSQMGRWFASLVAARSEVSPEMVSLVAARTREAKGPLEQIRTLAEAIQRDVRYVHVALGRSGYQPRVPREVLTTGYGDCKDKSNLLRLLLAEVGVEAHLVLINSERGALQADSPAGPFFDHAVLAIRPPAQIPAGELATLATISDAAGRPLLLFDPTDELTPFGQISGGLRDRPALLVEGTVATLVTVPPANPPDSGVDRALVMRLAADGSLTGEVQETWRGDWASMERLRMAKANASADLSKPMEWRLADSIANYQVSAASASELTAIQRPYEWRYAFAARGYAKPAGDLLMVRARVLGRKGDLVRLTGEPRRHPLAFEALHVDRDTMRIELPPGYVVDTLPEPVDVHSEAARYSSRTRVEGNALIYERSFELRALDVPLAKVPEILELQAVIDRDERAFVVLRRQPQSSP